VSENLTNWKVSSVKNGSTRRFCRGSGRFEPKTLRWLSENFTVSLPANRLRLKACDVTSEFGLAPFLRGYISSGQGALGAGAQALVAPEPAMDMRRLLVRHGAESTGARPIPHGLIPFS